MPRPATGTVEWRDSRDGSPGAWWARITLSDGTRPWIQLKRPYPNSPQGRARAKEAAAGLTERAREKGIVSVPKPNAPKAIRIKSGAQGETLDAWSKRWLDSRRERGYSSVRDDDGRIRSHITPLLGAHVMAEIRTPEIEHLVSALDAKVRAGTISWKTARNVWAVITRMFKDASRSKITSLRCRTDNPTQDVEGPDRGGEKNKAFLYPSEVSSFLRCDLVPLEWRELMAVAVYLGARAGELEALEWDDVDLSHGKITVHRAIARDAKGRTKGTKSEQPRTFNAEPELLPLLRTMHARAGGKGRILNLPRHRDLASKLRFWLEKAGCNRPELYASDATRLNLRFHDLRATHITWSAIRKDNPALIMARVGHEDYETMQRYLRQAEVLQTNFGDVFEPLPQSLVEMRDKAKKAPLGMPSSTRFVTGFRPTDANYMKTMRSGRDSNPRPPA